MLKITNSRRQLAVCRNARCKENASLKFDVTRVWKDDSMVPRHPIWHASVTRLILIREIARSITVGMSIRIVSQ